MTLVRTDVSEERIASIIREIRINELETIFTLMMEAKRSLEMSVPTRATGLHIAEDGIPYNDQL
jgi:hypothetical protein